MKITSEVVKIDAEFARKALGNAAPNRTISRVTVDGYKRTMLAGFWRVNGEAIVFYEDGTLADGQHRLLAVIAADGERPGFSIVSIVTRGVANGARFNMCRVRSVADQYGIDGGKDCNAVMAFVRVVSLWSDEHGFRSGDYSGYKPTYDELADLITRDWRILAVANTPHVDHLLPRRALKVIRWLFLRVPGADEWLDTVINGADLAAKSPAFVLRNFLIRNQQKKHTAGLRNQFVSSLIIPCAVTIKAWNAHMQHRKIEVLTFREDEKFPIPFGLQPLESAK